MLVLLGLGVLLLQTAQSAAPSSYARFCYLAAWSSHRPGLGAFNPEDINADVCTHLCLAFFSLDDTGTRLKTLYNTETPQFYNRLNALKTKNPKLKTLVSLGGWGMGSKLFSVLVANHSNINDFTNNVIKFLRDQNFDGLDLDWEYPTARGSPPEDKHRFTNLVRSLRTAFDSEGKSTSRDPLVLTAALAVSQYQAQRSYEAHKIFGYLDYINMMTYSLHGLWEKPLLTGHHSPLYGNDVDPVNSVDHFMKYWTNLGVPKHKILIGLAFYGNTLTLNDTSVSEVGSPAQGPGRAGPYTKSAGVLAYYEICELVNGGTEHHISSNQSVPYLVDHERWVGYDDEKSLQEKVRYVINSGYGGIMVWTLDMDDFHGTCGKKFPLMNSVKDSFTSIVG